MDFSFSEEQQEIQNLAAQILGDKVTHERLKEIEASAEWFDRDLWGELVKAGLVGIALPEEHGGGGFGILEAALVLEEIGRTVAPVPYYATVVLGALPIAEFGSDEQKKRLLPGVVDGEVILTAALSEDLNLDPMSPTTTAKNGRLNGTKMLVPAAHLATAIIVPTSDGVFVVDPKGDGVEIERLITTSGEPQFKVTLNDAEGEPLGDASQGAEITEWIVQRATAALCAIQLGVCEQALKMTAEYTSTREQFERPLAAFQAVAQRAADAYIDTEGVRLTAWQAVWRLAEGLPSADEIAVAKFWAAEGGQRVAHAAQHLHGGIGVDVDYPLHRYFLWAKQCELTLGSATPQLVKLGKSLADQPV
ncbi:MAG: acyl-CoA/acyl-ACP dehydrogenase [Acidimicrobiia bacterium]|nr:acyl-CoA/acyl-ACP dehydrogenase [Acidimicrobiia bacterium]MBV9039612.1 acyl-CoA/acyl-ACP dehydrogenase [Acidimicrobiia bacterium]